ncbi:MAG: group 1 truncated hemoglobin [Planctomycetes bacterium]|nr:group 1 truncated hemoglobin [Planctomycetota bacterium]
MFNAPTLYDRIGGEIGLEKMVDGLYERVLADPMLAPFFKDTPMDKQRRMQREFMAVALGAAAHHSDTSLAWAHAERGITFEHFNRFCQHMSESLKAMNIDDATVHEVLQHMALYKNAIIGESY